MSVSGITSLDTTFSLRLDEASSTTLYVGEAPIGGNESAPVWRIKRLVTSGTGTSLLWADGNQFFDNVWDNRLSLSYT